MAFRGHVGMHDGHKWLVPCTKEQGSCRARQDWASPAKEGHREEQQGPCPPFLWEQLLFQTA